MILTLQLLTSFSVALPIESLISLSSLPLSVKWEPYYQLRVVVRNGTMCSMPLAHGGLCWIYPVITLCCPLG